MEPLIKPPISFIYSALSVGKGMEPDAKGGFLTPHIMFDSGGGD